MPPFDERDPFASPAEREPTLHGPLAERDPDAAPEESAEYRITGAVSFDDVLRRARRQGFVAGAAVGAFAGAAVVGLLALAASRPAWTRSAAPAPSALAAPDPAPAEPALAASGGGATPVAVPARAAERARAPPAAAALEPPRPAVEAAAPGQADDAAGVPPATSSASSPAAPPGEEVPAAEPDASVPATDASVAGRPPEEHDVTAALAARREALDACVDETPGDGAAARARRFRLLVVVEPSGRVSEARVQEEEIAATPLGVCLVRLARETTFAPFDGEPARLEVRVRSDDAE